MYEIFCHNVPFLPHPRFMSVIKHLELPTCYSNNNPCDKNSFFVKDIYKYFKIQQKYKKKTSLP